MKSRTITIGDRLKELQNRLSYFQSRAAELENQQANIHVFNPEYIALQKRLNLYNDEVSKLKIIIHNLKNMGNLKDTLINYEYTD